ncbi:MAG: calcium/sodium antiporter [Saprospiraceae bacterium]|nr:calcium/sodium antiporter [Saprospiraceae bacterium]
MGLVAYLIIFIVSLGALLYASDRFVASAENIGLAFGVPPFIIGVTIVAFGTSLPELATSIASVYSGSSEIVIGNVMGSNITNILLILGVTSFIGNGIKLDFDVMDIDMPFLFCSAFLLFFVLRDFNFGGMETSIFLLALVVFLVNSLKVEKEDETLRRKARNLDYIVLVGAAVLVYFGATYTVYSLEEIATILSIPPHIIALTVIALGTSLPELVVSLAAIRRGKHAMAVGNVLGSNIFNTYAVMGIASLFGDITVPESAVGFDMMIMMVATLLFGVMCIGGHVSKWEGGMLIVFYLYFISESVGSVL